MSPLVLMPLLLVAQTHSRWEASVRAEVRARSVTPQDVSSTAAGDGELRPRLSGAIFNGPWTLSGSYSPTVRTREPYFARQAGQPPADHSHVVQADVVWAKEGSARAFVGQFVNYGTLDLSTINRELAPGAPTPQVPTVGNGLGVVRELSLDTSAGVDWFLTQRLTFSTTAGFIYGGGTDAASRRSLPLQSSPRAGMKLLWLASPRDTLAFNLNGQYIRFFQTAATATEPANPGARIAIVEMSANYTRLLGVKTSLDFTLGLTGSYGDGPSPDPALAGTSRSVTGIGPLVAAGFSHREELKGQRLDFRLNGQLAPFVDRFAGTVYQRVEGGASLGWSNVHHWSAAISAGVARSLPSGPEAPLTTVYGEASAGYQGDPWWRIDLTSRLSVVRQSPQPVPAGMTPLPAAPIDTQWVVGLSLTLIAASEQPRTVSVQAD